MSAGDKPNVEIPTDSILSTVAWNVWSFTDMLPIEIHITVIQDKFLNVKYNVMTHAVA
jgi:hypothetical protein